MQISLNESNSLILILQKHFPESSKATLLKWIKWGRVSVDGMPCAKPNSELAIGQTVSVGEKSKAFFYKNVQIIYEDRYMIVINKPSGLLSVPDHTEHSHALGLMRKYFQTKAISAVHRIDRETSGLMIFAKGKPAADAFDVMFEEYNIHRQYIAIAEGQLKEDQGTWTSRLVELPTYDVVSTTNPDEGKLAITHFSVYRRSAQFTYLNLTLETGRKHQIRVHCKDAGHVIVGDKRYGSLCNPVKRLCLHSYKLSFTHPFTQKPMNFTAELPKHFITLGAQLENSHE